MPASTRSHRRLEKAPAPAQAPSRAMYRHILVPTDGSALSDQAAAAAVDLASLMGARITALHVVPEIPAIELEAWARHDEKYIEHLEKAFEKRAMVHVGKVKELADKAGIACETVYLHAASPASEIVIIAGDRKCDLIFMASHGMGEAADPLLGSVTAKVLARGTIPVLVHRPSLAKGR